MMVEASRRPIQWLEPFAIDEIIYKDFVAEVPGPSMAQESLIDGEGLLTLLHVRDWSVHLRHQQRAWMEDF